jgi:uncharacterized membrane protein
MSVTTDMVASFRKPGAVMKRHLAFGRREDRALIYVMASCLMFFVAKTPVLSREAHLNSTDIGPALGSQILIWMFIIPLVLYFLAGVLRVLLRIFGCKGADWYETRLALFWSLLVITPISLLNGLTEGLLGKGTESAIVAGAGVLLFSWVLFGSLRAACKGAS